MLHLGQHDALHRRPNAARLVPTAGVVLDHPLYAAACQHKDRQRAHRADQCEGNQRDGVAGPSAVLARCHRLEWLPTACSRAGLRAASASSTAAGLSRLRAIIEARAAHDGQAAVDRAGGRCGGHVVGALLVEPVVRCGLGAGHQWGAGRAWEHVQDVHALAAQLTSQRFAEVRDPGLGAAYVV